VLLLSCRILGRLITTRGRQLAALLEGAVPALVSLLWQYRQHRHAHWPGGAVVQGAADVVSALAADNLVVSDSFGQADGVHTLAQLLDQHFDNAVLSSSYLPSCP